MPVLWRSGDSSGARALFDSLLSRSPAQEVALHTAMARMETERSFVRAIEHCDSALSVPGITAVARAEVLAVRAMNLQNASRFDQVPRAISAARSEALAAGAAEPLATSLIVDSAFRYYALRFDEAKELADEAASIMSTQGRTAALWLPEAMWPSLLAVGAGDATASLSLADVGLRNATALTDAPAIAYWQMMRSRALLDAGQLEAAFAEASEVLALSEQLDLGLFTAATAGTTAYRAALLQGDRSAMRETRSLAEAMLAHPGPIHRTGLWLLALRADTEGDPDGAAELCTEALNFLDAPAPHLTAPGDIADDVILTRLLLRAGRRDDANRVLRHSVGRQSMNPINALAEGTALHVEALLNDDRSLLSAAVRAFRRNRRPLPLASALEDLGVLSESESESCWKEALGLYETCGAERSAARVRRRLRTVGVSASRRGGSRDPRSLSPAEERIARLVAERLTTSEIARELSVSPHTVVTHIRHIYAKLGLSSRQELAAHFSR